MLLKKLLITATIFVLSLGSTTVFAKDAVIPNILGYSLKGEDIGKTFESGNFNANKATHDLKVQDISIDSNYITLTGTIADLENNTSGNVQISGNLYRSFSQEEGYKTFVGDLTEASGNYQVLYFLIKNDTKKYDYVLNKKLQSEPFFTIYLKDKSGQVLVFEDQLAKLNFDSSILDSTVTKMADAKYDTLWFTKILTPKVKGTEEYTVKDDGISIQTVRQGSASTPLTYRIWYYGGDKFKENVRVEVYGQITDVGSVGTSNAQTTLKLIESLYRNDVFYSNDTNYQVNYGAASKRNLVGKIALGTNTTVNNMRWYGNYVQANGFSSETTLTLGAGYGIGGAGASVDYAIKFPQSTKINASTTNYYQDTNGNWAKTAMHEITPSKGIYLDDNNEDISLAAVVSTINSGLQTDYYTVAKTQWTFDIYYYTESTTPVSYTDFGPEIPYLANAV